MIKNPILRIAVPLLAIPAIGTLGFMMLEGWSLLDSIYMAVITLTTVGFEEIHPLSGAGRLFVIAYLILGLGVFVYGLTQIGEAILRGQLLEFVGSRKMDTAVKSLNDHTIVCGFGRMGRSLCQKLEAAGQKFVIVDRDEGALGDARAAGWYVLCGDATDDRTLQDAGVERARGLAAVLSSDADNLYVVLSARLLQQDLQILARATAEKSVEKMRRAGANRVINIYETGAHRMAQLLRNANLEEFMELFSHTENELDIVQLTVTPDAAYCGRTVADSGLRQRDIMIVCIWKSAGNVLMPPPSSTRLEAGDKLIALGKATELRHLLAPA